MKIPANIFLTALCLLFPLLSACNSQSKLGGLSPAKGEVKYNGKPIAGATVTFSPVSNAENQRSATAVTDAHGKFSMMTLNPGDGVYPGKYAVTIQKVVYSEDIPERGGPPEGDIRMVAQHLPSKYGDASTSGLSVDISKEGNAAIVFELTGEVDSTPKKLSDIKKR